MIEIGQDCGMPTLFIRYNPDAWQMDGVVQQISEETRLSALGEMLKKALAHAPPPGVTAIWMFYNNRGLGEMTIVQ